jgi:hypothetical protein
VSHPQPPPFDAWQPWTPPQVAGLLAGVDAPWWVIGGYAIDLFLGRETRPHSDIEIATTRDGFTAIRERLQQRYVLYAAGSGTLRRLAPGDAYPKDRHQCWVLDERAAVWRLDVMQEPGDATTWRCRRDERIAVPRDAIIRRTAGNIAYLSPEAVLLFKAKGMREKDVSDFTLVAPLLQPTQRAWLIDALTRVHPGHSWIAALR